MPHLLNWIPAIVLLVAAIAFWLNARSLPSLVMAIAQGVAVVNTLVLGVIAFRRFSTSSMLGYHHFASSVSWMATIVFAVGLLMAAHQSRMPDHSSPVAIKPPAIQATPSEIKAAGFMSEFRKGALYGFIAFLSLTALLGIVGILMGGRGWEEFRIVLTSFTVAISSVCFFISALYAERTDNSVLGWIGIGLACISALSVLLLIWGDFGGGGWFWRFAWIATIFAIAAAHCLGVLAIALVPHHQWVQWVTTIMIGLLAVILAGAVAQESFSDLPWREVTVLTILVLLGTVVVPILGKIEKPLVKAVEVTK